MESAVMGGPCGGRSHRVAHGKHIDADVGLPLGARAARAKHIDPDVELSLGR